MSDASNVAISSGTEAVQGLSVNDVAFTILSFSLGASLLSLPNTLAACGFMGIPVLFAVNALNFATSALMSRVLDRLAARAEQKGVPLLQRDWTFLAAEVWGPAGKLAMRIFLVLELSGYIVAYTVVASVHLQELLSGFYPLSAPLCAVASSAVSLLLCFVPPKAFVPVNASASMFFLLACAAFLATGLLLPEWPDMEQLPLLEAPGLVNGIGIMFFVGASHSCYPTIKQTMQEPSRYEQANARGYAAVVVLLLAVAVPGYLMFGASVQETFVSNIGRGFNMQPLPTFSGGRALRTLSAAAIMLKNLCVVPLTAKPLAVMIVGVLPSPRPVGLSDDDRATHLFQALVVVLSMFVAIRFADDMALVVDVIGGVLCANISFVVPPLAYWTLFRDEIGPWIRLGLLATMVMGVATMADTLLLQMLPKPS